MQIIYQKDKQFPNQTYSTIMKKCKKKNIYIFKHLVFHYSESENCFTKSTINCILLLLLLYNAKKTSANATNCSFAVTPKETTLLVTPSDKTVEFVKHFVTVENLLYI